MGSRQHSLADVVLELPLIPMQVRHRDVLQLLLHKAQPLLLHCGEKRGWAGTCPPSSIAPDSPHSFPAAPWGAVQAEPYTSTDLRRVSNLPLS